MGRACRPFFTARAFLLVIVALLAWAEAVAGQSPGSPAGPAAAASENKLVLYPETPGIPRSRDFNIKVRNPGETWQDLPAYYVKVIRDVETRRTPQDTSIASFDFAGAVEVSVTCNGEPVKSARIRPLSYGITPKVDGNTVTFSLSQPRNISMEINGDIFHNLQLFANPLEARRPDPADPNVIYYGPGVHQVNTLRVPSDKTVYIAGGALIQGQFRTSNAENIRFAGRGILLGATGKAFLIEDSKNVEIEGVIVAPASYTVQIGNSQNVTVRNIKSFSAGGNNDGINVFCSSDVTIDGVFMRNSDDCIAIYGHRWNYYGDVKNLVVKNSTLWADVAHPINIGTHGDSDKPNTLENLTFTNMDILDQMELQLDYQGCIAINAGDSNLIRNVKFENIRVEDFRQGQLINMRVMYNRKYNTSAGRGIENVLFKDVTYQGGNANLSVIAGYDDSRAIKNVVFENLKINGRVIADDMPGKPAWFKTGDLARFYIGEHVDGLVFRAAKP